MTEPLHVVLGAGAVGQTVAQQLLQRGARVRFVDRKARVDMPGAEVVSGDVADLDVARETGKEAHYVYNCLNPPYHRWPSLWPLLEEGAETAAAQNGATLVTISNLYVYGRTRGVPMREDTPQNAHTAKGRVRAKMDAQAMAAHQAGRFPVVILRASDFVGPKARNAMLGSPVAERIVAGKSPQFIGNPEMRHTYTYVPDVARAMIHLAQREEAWGETWHVPSPEAESSRTVIHRMCEIAGERPRLQVMPKFLLWLSSLVSPMIREVREMAYQFHEPFLLDDTKCRAAYPELAPTPLEDALQATIAWFRDNPPQLPQPGRSY